MPYRQPNGERRDPPPQEDPPGAGPSAGPPVWNMEIPTFSDAPPQTGQTAFFPSSARRVYASKTRAHVPQRYS
jgi:hypothetical protein